MKGQIISYFVTNQQMNTSIVVINIIGAFKMVLWTPATTCKFWKKRNRHNQLHGKTCDSGIGSVALERLMLQFQLKLSWVPDVVVQIITLYYWDLPFQLGTI